MGQFFEQFSQRWDAAIKYIILPALTVLTAYNTVVTDKAKSQLELEAQRLQNISAQIQNDLKTKEYEKQIKFDLYKEVKEAVKKSPEEQKVVSIFVIEMLADAPDLKNNFLNILKYTTNNPEVRIFLEKNEKEETKFNNEQTSAPSAFTIDVFYVDDTRPLSKGLAEQAAERLKKHFPATYQIRTRLLPRSINAQGAYKISRNEIRFQEVERAIAMEALTVLDESPKLMDLEAPYLRETVHNTPNYISIFIRNR